jgi:retinol dehydrogenase-14
MAADAPVRIVTGATAGIGHALVRRLATQGPIALVARDQAKADAVRREIVRDLPGASVSVHLADLSKLDEVRSLAAELTATYSRIGALVNCAAVFSARRIETADGLELMFATNHLGPFLLTNLLLTSLRASGAGRVLTLAAPSTVRMDFDDLQGKRRFRALVAFGATKTANLLSTFELARRVAGTGVTANAVHPGLTRTSLMRQAPLPLRAVLALSPAPDRAAGRIAPLLVDEEFAAANGLFFRGGRAIDPPQGTRDAGVQRHLWDVSEQLAGLA